MDVIYCRVCRRYDSPTAEWGSQPTVRVGVCDNCRERHQRRGWESICPPGYLDTDPARLPCPEATQAALQWQYGAIGLNLFGPTGTGKSRTAWLLLKQLYFSDRCRSIAAISARDLRFGLAGEMGESVKKADALLATWQAAGIVLLDDVFKSKPTEFVEEALFELLDSRLEANRPVLVTSNDTGQSLLARWSPDRGPAFLRRLREMTTAIAFKAPTTP